jgi:hypothetical protein
VRVASFVHSPLLPDGARGTTVDGMMSIADWFFTFTVGLAGLEPDLDADAGAGAHAAPRPATLPAPYGCLEHPKCTFPSDSINLWPYITGQTTTPPRTELFLGMLDGGALLDAGGLKFISRDQSPDWWYGIYSPNCTSATGTHPGNCDSGCLFDVGGADPTEHVNLKDARPADFARLQARFEELVASVGGRTTTDSDDDDEAAAAMAGLCSAMRERGGFFGPYSKID